MARKVSLLGGPYMTLYKFSIVLPLVMSKWFHVAKPHFLHIYVTFLPPSDISDQCSMSYHYDHHYDHYFAGGLVARKVSFTRSIYDISSPFLMGQSHVFFTDLLHITFALSY